MDNLSIKEIVINGLCFVFGVFLYALTFNLFLTPNNLVVSGFSGVAIVVQQWFGVTPSIFIYVMNLLMLVVGLIVLGWSATKRNLAGSLLYPYMIIASMPIAKFLSKYLISDDFYLVLLFSTIFYGVSSGLIYRSGFSTGGSDIIMQIIHKKVRISESKAMIAANTIIIILGMFTFGLNHGIYSFIILAGSTYFVDKILFGVSNSKLFFITTKHPHKMRKLIIDEFETGLTIIPTKGGYTKQSGFLIMCVIANTQYYLFKERVLEVDPNAFIVIDKCYEVNGGVKRSSIPFL